MGELESPMYAVYHWADHLCGLQCELRLHSQEGTWNKVGMIRKILEDTPPERAEWIVYMQPETFFDDTTFAIPFDSYRDKDLILIGNQTALRNGQMRGEPLS